MSNADSPEAAPERDLPRSSDPKPFEHEPRQVVTAKPLNIMVTVLFCFAGLVFPGLGHILLKRWVRGLLFAASVLLMFAVGISMQGKLYTARDIQQPLQIFAFFADVGVGLAYFLAENAGMGIGDMTRHTFDYGTTYLWVAGLLNYLIVLDAFDIAQGRKP